MTVIGADACRFCIQSFLVEVRPITAEETTDVAAYSDHISESIIELRRSRLIKTLHEMPVHVECRRHRRMPEPRLNRFRMLALLDEMSSVRMTQIMKCHLVVTQL